MCELQAIWKMTGKRTTKGDIIEVSWRLDSLDLASDVVVVDLVAEVGNSRVRRVVCAEDLNGLLDHIRAIDVIDCAPISIVLRLRHCLMILTSDDSKGLVVTRIAKNNTGARGDGKAVDVLT